MTGGARQMATAAARGALKEEGVRVRLLHAPDAKSQDVLEADGYVFVTPENLASMSGLMKDFFDRTYYAVLDKTNGRPYIAMICAGSDGSSAARQIETICTGWRLRRVAEPLIVSTHAQAPEEILASKIIRADEVKRCEDMGATMAFGIAMGVF